MSIECQYDTFPLHSGLLSAILEYVHRQKREIMPVNWQKRMTRFLYRWVATIFTYLVVFATGLLVCLTIHQLCASIQQMLMLSKDILVITWPFAVAAGAYLAYSISPLMLRPLRSMLLANAADTNEDSKDQ